MPLNDLFERVRNSFSSTSQWRDTLTSIGIDLPRGKTQGPCPCCGGTDRFTFDDKYGNGNWYCRQCEPSSGDGIALVANVFRISQLEAAKELARAVGIDTDSNLSSTELDKIRAQRAKQRAEQEEKERKEQAKKIQKGGNRAQEVIDNYCKPADTTQVYLARKKINPYGTFVLIKPCLLYTSPSPRDRTRSRMPSSA